MAFKMKGSPMHRNFGIGESPILKTALQHTVDDVEEHQFEHSEDLQTDEEHNRHHWPDGTKRTEREIFEYDENQKEESKEGGNEVDVLEEGRTDLSAAAEKGSEEEPPLKHTYSTQYENQELTQDQKDHNASSHPHDKPEKSSGAEYGTGGTLDLSSRGGGWKSGNNKT